MSRIGKQPVPVPGEVKVEYKNNLMSVKGPKGSLELIVHSDSVVNVSDSEIVVSRPDDSKDSRRIQGLVRSLINNLVVGVSKGFEKKLAITGVGYKAAVQGKVLNMALGYSHPINYDIPAGITIAVEKNTSITISGADKQLVGSVAAKVRSFRGPEPYKGKGIRYEDEYIRRKVGKAGK